MVTALKVLGIGCLCAALVCCIVALATTNWMMACIPIAKLVGEVPGVQSSLPPQFRDASFCFNSGLFNIAMEMPGMSISLKMTLKYIGSDTFIQATAALLIIGVIFFVVALAGLILAYRTHSINVEKKMTSHVYSKVAVSIFLFGCLLFGTGIVTYQVGQSSVLHNPLLYFAQISPTFESLANQPTSNSEISSIMKSFEEEVPGRKRRQSDYPDMYSNSKNIEDYEFLSPGNYSDHELNQFSSIMKNLDPVFGYSLYVAWLGWVLAVISLVVNSVIVYRSKIYKNGSQPLPVL